MKNTFKSSQRKTKLQDKIKIIDKEIQELSFTMEQVYTVKKHRKYYKEFKANPSDNAFFEEYKSQITLYETALSELKKSYSKFPNSKDILTKLDKLQEKEYPYARVFFLKAYYERTLQDTKKLWYLYG